MALFSSWFKAKPDAPGGEGAPAPEEQPEASAVPPPPPPRPVAAVRTVKPNNVQPVRVSGSTARSPISLTSRTPGSPMGQSAFSAPATRNIAFGKESNGAAEMEAAPQIPLHAEATPPAPSNPDAVVHLELGDFVDRIPTNLLRSGSVDRSQGIDFLVSELYSDLTKGRATVPASVIYRKCPAIFARPVTDTEDVEVHLPLHRLVEQMGATFTPRQDQTPEESVAEIETPFLQVAMEDNARLPKAPGTSTGATVRAIGLPNGRKSSLPTIAPPTVRSETPSQSARRTKQISPISPLKQPVDTRSIAAPNSQTAGPINSSKRPPSTVRASVAGGKIRLSAPSVARDTPPATPVVPAPNDAALPPKVYAPASPRMPAVSPSHQVTKKTARIQIPPISLRPAPPGSPRPPVTSRVKDIPPPPTGAPEPLTSFKPSGSSTPSPSGVPTFRSTPPPPSYVKPPPPSFSPTRGSTPGATPETALIQVRPPEQTKKEPSIARDQLIEMSLAGVLRGLPSTSLVVDPSSVPDSARISLPFGLIEPQLSNGRVSVPLQAFREALPSAFTHVLAEDCDLTEVPIPLQEVFQNLPSEAISQREDQIIEEARNSFPTPFSQKAEEDARRFGTPPPVAATPPPPPAPETKAPGASLNLEPETPAAMEEAAVEVTPSETFADKADVSEAATHSETIALPDPEAPAQGESHPAPEEPTQAEGPLKEAGDPIGDAAPVEDVAEPVVTESEVAPSPSRAVPIPAPVRVADTALQTLFMTEDELDAKTVTRLASQLPGIDSCSVMFGDGLLLASSQPQDGQTEGFSAMAPALYQRALNFTTELSLGELQACTLYTQHGLLSLFTHGNICLSVRHSGRGFLPGVREKLVTITRELAGMYATAPAEPAEKSAA